MLLCAALLLPPTWGMFSGALSFDGPYQAASDGAGVVVPLISQYQGLSTDNVNCGPASVAAILRAMRPNSLPPDDAGLVAAIRDRTGAADGDTNAWMLARALDAFGVGGRALLADDGEAGDSGILAPIEYVLDHDRPVLALVYGADLGRGAQYGDHWLVITAVDKATGEARVMDPDTQAARTTDWQPGGVQWLPMWRLRAALRDASGDGSIVALAAGVSRSTPPTPRMVLPPLAAALLFWQGRGKLLRSLPTRWRRALRRWTRQKLGSNRPRAPLECRKDLVGVIGDQGRIGRSSRV
jgi:hypothetical protein